MKFRNLNYIFKNERGQALVEFALVVTILLSLILGMLEFGWIFNGKISINSAAREGARVAIIYDTDTAASTPVLNAVANSLGTSSVTSVTAITIFNVSTAKVTVTGEIKPLVGYFINKPVIVSSTAIMRLE